MFYVPVQGMGIHAAGFYECVPGMSVNGSTLWNSGRLFRVQCVGVVGWGSW